jgi:hypothetical protein
MCAIEIKVIWPETILWNINVTPAENWTESFPQAYMPASDESR